MSTKSDQWMSRILTASAVVMAIAIIHREFLAAPITVSMSGTSGVVTYDKDWRSMLVHAITIGDTSAPVRIVEFVDFECPVCRGVHTTTVRETLEKYGKRVAMSYVHFPIPRHQSARIAAQAAECGDQQGRVAEVIEAIFAKQDSLARDPWASIAREAGLQDTVAFRRCVTSPVTASRIDSGFAIAKRKQIRGTPSFFINGWRLSTTPTTAELSVMIDGILQGRTPAQTVKSQ